MAEAEAGVCLEAPGGRKLVEVQQRQCDRPRFTRNRPEAVSESGKEEKVGGERMQSTSAPGRDSGFEKNT